jgi:hypothetical protein
MSSVAGRFGYPNRSAYFASKWGFWIFQHPASGENKTVGHENARDRTSQKCHKRTMAPIESGLLCQR